MHRPIILAITGASGAAYAVRLLEVLLAARRSVFLTISPSGKAVLETELGLNVDLERFELGSLLEPSPSGRGQGEGESTTSDFAIPSRRESAIVKDSSIKSSSNPLTSPRRVRADPVLSPGERETNADVRYCHYQDLMSPIASGSFLTDGMVVCPCSGSTLGAIAHSIGSNLIHRAAEVQLKERRKLILVPRETPLSLPQLDNMRAATAAGAVVLPASPGFYHVPKSIDDLVDFVVAR
ncbi:MAG TPA: UbiX family flavin prenyltransferase, partial [Pirellulales bacterium]